MTEHVDDAQKINKKIADQLYLHATVSNITVICIASLYFFFLLQAYTEPLSHFAWPSLMFMTAGYRLLLCYRRKQTPNQYTAKQWTKYYTISSGFVGLGWGSIFFFPYINHDVTLYFGLLMVVFGVTASAVLVLSAFLRAFFVYTFPIIVGFIISLYQLDVESYYLFIFIIIVYYTMLSIFARAANQQFLKSIALTSHNQELIEKLREEVEQRESLIKARTEQLEQSNQAIIEVKNRLQNVINGAELGYWDWNYQTGDYEVNKRWLEMLGLSRSNIKDDISDWSERIHPDDRETMMAIVEESIKQQKPYTIDFRMAHKDGHWVWLQGCGSLIESDLKTHVPLRLCGTHQDISYRKAIEQKLEYQAKHDFLTNLFNRTELEKRFQEEIVRAKRYKHKFCTFMIDIDHFKQINDLHGHQSGDYVLKQFADFLQETIRTTDYVARYGGEEFVVILPETLINEAEELAERLRIKASQLNLELNNISLSFTISIGISCYPEHGQYYGKLLEASDSAMYRAKEKGRNCIYAAGK